MHTLLALSIILYPVLVIQKEHPQPFFTYIKIPTHPSGVSKTHIASTAHVMTHGLKFTFMPQSQPVNFHREVSLTLLCFCAAFHSKVIDLFPHFCYNFSWIILSKNRIHFETNCCKTSNILQQFFCTQNRERSIRNGKQKPHQSGAILP